MSDTMDSSGGQQYEPSQEPKKPPSYEPAPEPKPEPEIPPAVEPEPPASGPVSPDPSAPNPSAAPDPSAPVPPAATEEPLADYTTPGPTIESVSRGVEELHAAAFAAAAEPTEADLVEASWLDDPIAAEEEASWEDAVAREDAAASAREAAERAAKAARAPAARSAASSELRPLTEDEEKLFATLSHLSVFFLPIIGPLLVLLFNQKRSAWVSAQAREAFNFHINLVLLSFVSVLAIPILIGLCGFAYVGIASLVLPIIGTIQTLAGKDFRYPWILRFLR